MKRLLWIPVILLFAGLLAYGYGLFALYQLRQAIASEDTEALARLVDWTQVQADLAEGARAQVATLDGEAGAEIAAAVAALPAGPQTLGRLAPALAAVVDCQRWPSVAGYQTVTLACGTDDTPLATVEMTLMLEAGRWRVTAITPVTGAYQTLATTLDADLLAVEAALRGTAAAPENLPQNLPADPQ